MLISNLGAHNSQESPLVVLENFFLSHCQVPAGLKLAILSRRILHVKLYIVRLL